METNIQVKVAKNPFDDTAISCVYLQGRMNSKEAADLRSVVIDQLQGKDSGILIELSELEYIDSYGLGILASLAITLSKKKIPFVLAGANAHTKNLIEMSLLNRILPMFETQEKALEHLGKCKSSEKN